MTHGVSGDGDFGVDIATFLGDGEGICSVQCKGGEVLPPRKIREIADKYFKYSERWSGLGCSRFLLITACPLNKTEQTEALAEIHARFEDAGILFEFWDALGLRDRLVDHPEIVFRHTSQHSWVDFICGPAGLRGLPDHLPSKVPRATIKNLLHALDLGPSRFVRLIDKDSKLLLGQAIRVDRSHVLTSSEVVASQGCIEVMEGGTEGSPTYPATPFSEGLCRGSELRLFEATGREDLEPLEFHHKPFEGVSWRSGMWLDVAGQGLQLLELKGTLARENEGRWELEVDEDVECPSHPRACIGAGVFLAEAGSRSWKLGGILQQARSEALVFEMSPVTNVEDLKCLEGLLGSRVSEQYRKKGIDWIVDSLPESLARTVALRAENQPGWQRAFEAQKSVRHLAEALVDTDPGDLAVEFSEIHHQLLVQSRPDDADGVVNILLRALPLAMQKREDLCALDSSAVDVFIEHLSPVVIEAILAARDGGSSAYTRLSRASENLDPVSEFRIRRTGEYGPDTLAEVEGLKDEILQQLILKGDPAEERKTLGILSVLASTPGLRAVPFVTKEDLRNRANAIDEEAVSKRDALIGTIDRAVGRKVRGGRRLYFLLRSNRGKQDFQAAEDEKVVQGLRKHLSQLRVVHYEGQSSQGQEFETLIKSLREIFLAVETRKRQISSNEKA